MPGMVAAPGPPSSKGLWASTASQTAACQALAHLKSVPRCGTAVSCSFRLSRSAWSQSSLKRSAWRQTQVAGRPSTSCRPGLHPGSWMLSGNRTRKWLPCTTARNNSTPALRPSSSPFRCVALSLTRFWSSWGGLHGVRVCKSQRQSRCTSAQSTCIPRLRPISSWFKCVPQRREGCCLFSLPK